MAKRSNDQQKEERFSISSNVVLPSSIYDSETETLQPDYYSRRRTQAERMKLKNIQLLNEKEKAEQAQKKRGIRIPFKIGVPILLVSFLFFVTFLLILTGQKEQLTRDAEKKEKSLREIQYSIDDYNKKLSHANSESKVCYYASQKLHMIPKDQSSLMELHVGNPTTVINLSGDWFEFLGAIQQP